MNKETLRMQMLAGIITENEYINENQSSFFNTFKQFVIDYLKEGDQDVDVSQTNSFDELKNKINEYWGWEDEQTVWMLEKFIKSYFDTDQIVYMLENYIRNNI
jgi:hypothetical protein